MVETDMGFDLVYSGKSQVLTAHSTTTVEVGKLSDYGIQLLPTQGAFVCNRSSLMFNHGLLVGLGCIDQGYTGTIKVYIQNNSPYDYEIKPGDKIGQLVVVQLAQYVPRYYERGDNGFGSTGR